jgi:hypothetical protein
LEVLDLDDDDDDAAAVVFAELELGSLLESVTFTFEETDSFSSISWCSCENILSKTALLVNLSKTVDEYEL